VKRKNEELDNMANIGNFTKHAVENFEENIVNQKDYLEKTKDDKASQMPHKFH